MHIWLALLAREAGFLLMLTLLGSGPAAFLSDRFDAAARIAMAPVFGFCVGMSVTSTLIQFWPANTTHWVLVPLLVASVAVAIWRLRARGRRLRLGLTLTDAAQLLVVCVVVAGPLTYTLHERHTVGPADYFYTDGVSYVSETDGEMTRSLSDASSAFAHHRQFANLTQFNWGFRANFPQQLDASALEANVNGILGVGSVDTWAPFLIVIMVTGGLGAFAAVRYATQSRSWVSVLAGALFGGPVFLELYYDTYQAAICGLALMVPLVVMAFESFRARRIADLALSALVLSGFLNVYPLFVPLVVLAGIVVGGWLGWQARRRGSLHWTAIRSSAVWLLALGALAVALEPVAFSRDVSYARGIINNTVPLPRLGFRIKLDVFPAWLAQTRGYWNMTSPAGSVSQFLLGGLIPLAFLGVIVCGLRRYRWAIGLVVLAVVCALVAEYSFASRQDCTYCAQRNLLPIAPIGIILLALGVYALWRSPGRWLRWLAVPAALLIIGSVGARTRVEAQRYANGSYFVDSADRTLLNRVPSRDPGLVALEGYDASIEAQAEEGFVYFLAGERLGDRVTVSTAGDDHHGLAYLTFDASSGPWPAFDPSYRFVLTRLGAVHTARTIIARDGPFALETRARPLDVLPIAGLAVPLARIDPGGVAWVQPNMPLVLNVSGYTSARRVWVRLTFAVKEPVRVPAGLRRHTRLRGGTLSMCVPATGTSPLRVAKLTLTAAPIAGPVPNELFPPPVPLEGIALTGMRAVVGACSV